MEREEATLLRHEPCPQCGSRDNLARYSDGHGYCFGCQHYEHGESRKVKKPVMSDAPLLKSIEYVDLPKRKIRAETARKWGYGIAEHKGKTVQVASYWDPKGARIVAQKLRYPNKSFLALGDIRKAGLYGQQLWRDGGKMVVVTEGEIDALSVSQLQGNKWPVVSIPTGSAGAVKAFRRNLEWLEKFESVVLMFDADKPGQDAAIKCAQLLTPGKAKIATLPLKDPNECLQKGRGKEVIQAMWDARVYRPDGIVDGKDLWSVISHPERIKSTPYPWQGLNNLTRGLRQGEIVTLCAGTGVGKSTVTRELACWLLGQQERLGYLALEESVRRTSLGLMSVSLGKPLHYAVKGIPERALKKAFAATVGSGRCYLYDHFGSLDSANLLNRIRYMVKGCQCGWIILDHLSIVVSGMDSEASPDERRLIDNTMTALRSLVEELKCGMILVSHLKRPPGAKGHEEGLQVSLSHLRGSQAIAQLSDMVIGLERDQQAGGAEAHRTKVRVLKNRFTGETGLATGLAWNKKTCRLIEVELDDEAVTEDDE